MDGNRLPNDFLTSKMIKQKENSKNPKINLNYMTETLLKEQIALNVRKVEVYWRKKAEKETKY